MPEVWYAAGVKGAWVWVNMFFKVVALRGPVSAFFIMFDISVYMPKRVVASAKFALAKLYVVGTVYTGATSELFFLQPVISITAAANVQNRDRYFFMKLLYVKC